MKNFAKKMKGKKVLSLLLAMVMVLSVSSPAISPMLGIVAEAATGDPVELAFNNVFVFESWANNSLSSTVLVDGTPQTDKDNDGLELDIENGSFTLTKTVATGNELYTAFSMDSANSAENANYYMMDVEPNTTYTFSYNVTGNIYVFTPYVFFYDDAGLYIADSVVAYGTPGYGYNEFSFTTPANAKNIQLRWTIGDNSSAGNTGATTVTATVTDIAIFESELKNQYLSTQNMFSLEDWANNTSSSTTPSAGLGSVTPNVADGSIRFENTGTGYLWTGFGVDTAASNDAYYTIDVQGSTSYTLTYDLIDQNLLGPIYCQPFIVEMDSDGKCITYYPNQTAQYLNNKFAFTTQANTARIQVVFALITDGDNTAPRYVTVKNIGVYETSVFTSDFETITGYPHRLSYTEGAGTYGTLPTPANIPADKVFAGWYTGKDGSGKLISSETEISYESYTVYPKFETKIDEGSLKVVTNPTQTTYTVGEKFNPAGLVLQATVTTTEEVVNDAGETTTETRVNTYNVTSGYTYSPLTVGTTAGTQNITISYGGQTVTVPVTVVSSIDKTVTVNGAQTTVAMANNEYTLNLTSDFNRYELAYYSDSYVKGTLSTVAADSSTVTEEFFLEPSDNGTFASYIDGFLESIKYTNIATLKFEALNKDIGNFELYSVETILAGVPTDNMQYQQDSTHKVGIDLSKGGSLAYLEELSGDVVAVANGEGVAAEVDYKSQITTSGTQYGNVNLINRHDPGRYVQQSYYGTREDPYVTGDYNGVTWNYNPVQGGNYQFESSKIIDYRITANQIYVKTRPLDWGKYSDEYANLEEGDFVDNDNDGVYEEDKGDLMLDPRYGDDYITDSYMEAWYVFEDNTVKTYCRFVDYSGYPSATTTQELPAFYCVEPLNTFAYYNADTVWEEESSYDYANEAVKINDPDFWGVSADYNNMLIANDKSAINPSVTSKENWAAFMASDDENSFGIGIYSAGVTNFHYGTYPQIYKEPASGSTAMTAEQFDNADMYEGGVLTMPSEQDATSYIAPVNTMTFQSYNPYTYSYYIATGNLHDIREDFRRAVEKDNAATAATTVIAVPETAYMAGADGNSTVGTYYVNNEINSTDNSIVTIAESTDEMSFSAHIDGASYFTVDITNVTKPADDVDLYTVSGNAEVPATEKFYLNVDTNTEIFEGYYLAFNSIGLGFGEKATAKWVITGYDENNKVIGTYIAYTVLYASERTVGAVAESRYDGSANTEISSWITGANGVDHSQRAPLGSLHGDNKSAGYFIEDPLIYGDTPTTITGSSQTPDDYINVVLDVTGVDNGTVNDGNHVMQTATSGSDGSRAQSYLGLLKVDKSRYTNTNQIPNLKMGYDVLRVGSAPKDSLETYTTYYTLGTVDSYTATSLSEAPSGWTQKSTYTEIASSQTIPYRETQVPEYNVADIDGKYIHALNQGNSVSTIYSSIKRYSTAGTSLLCSLTDKGTLRDSVTQGYGLAEENYSEDSYAKFEEALEKAGTVLGDPSASQEEIDTAQKDLSDAMDTLVNNYYSLKYDNIFSAYEFSQYPSSMSVVSNRGTVSYANGALTVVNDTITDGEAYTNYGGGDDYYHVDLEPNTEYVFEYDVTTDLKAQAFMFFYNSSGGNAEAPTNMSIKTNNGAWGSKTESNPWFGNYTASAGTYHYVIKFTTGATTDKAGFRFGNTSNDPVTSTFSNIRVVDAAHYYEDATYSATEAVYKEHASYGTMATVTRPGYTFTGWQDASGNAVTGASIATDNLSVYSQWTTNSYTVTYNANGGSVSPASKSYKVTDTLTIPTPTRSGYVFAGWTVTTADGNWTANEAISGGASLTGRYGNVTLTAQWSEDNYVVTYDPAGGTVSPTSQSYKTTDTITLPTPTRTGYTFNNWKVSSAVGNWSANETLNAAASVSKRYGNVTLVAQWTANTYTIRFNANGGTGTMNNQTLTYDKAQSLTTNTFTMTDYAFMGWSTSAGGEVVYKDGESLNNLTSENGKVIDLYAVWAQPIVNVTFDNLVDISAWSDTVNNGTPVNETDTGFTVKSNDGAGEATCSSAFFTVEAGHKYVIESDIKGEGWDIYIFFHNETSTGTGLGFADGTSRMASGVNVSEVNGIKYTSTEFTAPAGATKAQLRVDANGSNNAVRFENIRVYDVTNTTYLDTVNKYVKYSDTYGELPVPVKAGQTFLGWVDEGGNTVTADTVMNSTSTVYLTSTWTTNPNSVDNDTVVIEYGIPVVINVLSNDNVGATNTVNGIGTLGVSDSDLGNKGYPTSKLTDKADTITLKNGSVTRNDDGTVTYTPTSTDVTVEDVFYYEVVVNGSYYYAKVTVIPATTIYYEDTFFTFNNATITKGGKTYNYNWQTVGTEQADIFQGVDRPGAYNFTDDLNNVYGFDAAYDGDVAYSDGTAHYVEVDKTAGANGPTAVFTFTGTGFDLFSATDNKSGLLTAAIYRGTTVDASNRVQGLISNTYFGYSYDSTSGEYVTSDNGALYQVPVIKARNLGYGTYTVVVTPMYSSAFDATKSGKTGVYVDSVRVYDPMGSGNAVANQAYMADGEYAPRYLEIRDTLVTPNDDGTYTVSDLGVGKSVFLDGGKTSMDDFAKSGPKNEVYLQKGNSVSFHIVTDRAELPATIQLGMKLTGKGGSTATVNLMNTDYNSWSEDITLNSATERYYNIESVVDWVEQSDGTYKTAAPVVVTNTSDAIISLTSLKWAFSSEESTATVLNLMSDEQTPVLAQAAVMRVANSGAQTNPQQTFLAKDNIAVEISGEPFTQGDSGVLTITTEQGVAGVNVNGTSILESETDENGKLVWTFEFNADVAGTMTFEVVAYDENGVTSETIYASTDVAGVESEEPTEPDDGETDDTTDDNTGNTGNSNNIGPDSFVKNLLNGIFGLLSKIFGLFFGGAAV